LGQTKDYKIGIGYFSAKQAASRSKGKEWLARNQDNVSQWSDMSTRGLDYCFSELALYSVVISVLVEHKTNIVIIIIIIISLNV